MIDSYQNTLNVIGRVVVLAGLVMLLANCGSSPTKPTDQMLHAGIALLTPEQNTQYQNGLKLMEGKHFNKAARVFSGLIQLQPKVDELHINLALAEYHQQDYDQAAQALETLNDATRPEAQNLKGLLAQKAGKFAEAKSHYQSAIAKNKNYSNALYNLALLYDVYLQDVAQAVIYYAQYIALNPEDEQTKDWLSQLQSSLE